MCFSAAASTSRTVCREQCVYSTPGGSFYHCLFFGGYITSDTHKGYFSIDKKTGRSINSSLKRGSEFSDDISAYDLILKNKERLLSFDEPTKFIFSHSALREDWDNPNVFQICTLKHSDSSTQKRQEVGRGLRLCVNQTGNRMDLETLGEEIHVAKELAETVPNPIYTRAQCRRMTLRGAEWADEMRSQIHSQFDRFIWDLRNLMEAFKEEHPIFTDEELLVLWQKVIQFVDVFYENGDYAFDEQLLINAHFRCAKLYIKLGDTEAALDELEGMLQHIENFDQYSDGLLGNHVVLPRDKWPTSLLVRPRDEKDARLSMTNSSPSTENAAMEYLRYLSDSTFDSIRSHSRFNTVEMRLQETARK